MRLKIDDKRARLSCRHLHLTLSPVKITMKSSKLEVLNKLMSGNDKFNFGADASAGQTIDLQGVASFASLVETLAQELGTTAGKIQGLLPNGPSSFEQLVGEIQVNSQGFVRTVQLFTATNQPLKLRVASVWRDGLVSEKTGNTGVESQMILGASADKIAPQARALARHLEELFSVLDRLATLGQSRIGSMSISEAELARFEYQEGEMLSSPKPRPSV